MQEASCRGCPLPTEGLGHRAVDWGTFTATEGSISRLADLLLSQALPIGLLGESRPVGIRGAFASMDCRCPSQLRLASGPRGTSLLAHLRPQTACSKMASVAHPSTASTDPSLGCGAATGGPMCCTLRAGKTISPQSGSRIRSQTSVWSAVWYPGHLHFPANASCDSVCAKPRSQQAPDRDRTQLPLLSIRCGPLGSSRPWPAVAARPASHQNAKSQTVSCIRPASTAWRTPKESM